MANAGASGTWWRCIRCDDLTDDVLAHNIRVHGTHIVGYGDFAMRRGSLHDPTGPRRAKVADEQLTMPMEGAG